MEKGREEEKEKGEGQRGEEGRARGAGRRWHLCRVYASIKT